MELRAPDPPDASLIGKVALVTGGGMSDGLGIGSAICLLLAARGCRVAVMDSNAGSARRTADSISESGGDALPIAGDVGVASNTQESIEQVIGKYGRLDMLVNNVGILGHGASTDDADEWDRVMAVNAKGMMLMAKYSLPHLHAGASIVNLGSTGAVRPSGVSGAYSASKGAVISLTLSLAFELGPRNIRVNCVCPGSIWTARVERRLAQLPNAEEARAARRMSNVLQTEGTPWDVARVVAFLAGPESTWVTGQIMTVDGGAHLWRAAPRL